MSKENIRLIFNTVGMFVLVITLILIYQSVYPKNIEDQIFNEIITLENSELIEALPSTKDFIVVHKKYDALNRQEQTIGVVYEVVARNGYVYDGSKTYGEIKLYVGIKEDIVYVEQFQLEQTAIYIADIRHYIEENFQGVLYTEIETIAPENVADLNAGATASDSTTLIKNMVLEVINIEYDLKQPEPYEAYYGEGYEITDTQTYENSLLQTKFTIGTSGYIYVVTGSGPYLGFDNEIYNGSITIEVLFDNNDEILEILLPEDLYGHTKSFSTRNSDYLASFKGLTLNEIQTMIDDSADLQTGATGSRELIDVLLEALINEVMPI